MKKTEKDALLAMGKEQSKILAAAPARVEMEERARATQEALGDYYNAVGAATSPLSPEEDVPAPKPMVIHENNMEVPEANPVENVKFPTFETESPNREGKSDGKA